MIDSVAAVASAVASGAQSAEAVVEEAFRRIRASEGLHCFLHEDEAGALDRARAIDRRRNRGEALGVLAGVPIAVKANIAVAGWPLSAGSRILEGHVAPVSATVIERLLAEDAIPVAQTNLDEFAMGSSCEWSAFGPTRNPWDEERVPGGSSGGSAAAVGAGAVPAALGSDTGGSVRQPAALCGVVGLRPTWGRVSRSGLVAFASSMDQVGPIGRTVADVAAVFTAIAGLDPLDSTTADVPVEAPPAGPSAPGDALRVGVVREIEAAGSDGAAVRGVREALARWPGARIVEVSVPSLEAAVPCYLVLSSCEASSNLARYDGVRFGARVEGATSYREMVTRTRSRFLGAEVQRRILLGTFALSAGYRDRYHAKAEGVRRRIARELDRALAEVDLLALPTAPGGAFGLGELLDDPLEMYRTDLYTTPASLAGLPAISIPTGLDENGLPLGLQLVGGRFDEPRLLSAARALERELRFRLRPAAERWGDGDSSPGGLP